jgi:hypothetical protein
MEMLLIHISDMKKNQTTESKGLADDSLMLMGIDSHVKSDPNNLAHAFSCLSHFHGS